MRMISWIILIAVLMTTTIFAESLPATLSDEEQLAVLQERLKQKQQTVPSIKQGTEYAAEFATACKTFLNTFDEGTEITIERLNQFMGTSAGKVTIGLIGWKILGKDLVYIFSDVASRILGILLLIPYILFMKGIYQHFVIGKRVLVSKEGKKKTYQWAAPQGDKLEGESYGVWVFFTAVAATVYTIIITCLIF